jgi:hypothetical protein
VKLARHLEKERTPWRLDAEEVEHRSVVLKLLVVGAAVKAKGEPPSPMGDPPRRPPPRLRAPGRRRGSAGRDPAVVDRDAPAHHVKQLIASVSAAGYEGVSFLVIRVPDPR